MIYVANAVGMWADLASSSVRGPGYFRADLPGAVRVILTDPGAAAGVPELIASVPSTSRVTVEDSWGAAPSEGVEVLRMPLMVRGPGSAGGPTPGVETSRITDSTTGSTNASAPDPATSATTGSTPGPTTDAATAPTTGSAIGSASGAESAFRRRPGTTVVRVSDPDRLAEAERVMVDGFPLRGFQPFIRGAALPPRLLETPGWDVWLGYRKGRPAAAGYTYDDGRAVGVYWLATLPDHRSTGMGRAVLATALASRPDRPWTLVATDAGRSLYESLGFATVSTAVWYVRDRSPDNRPT